MKRISFFLVALVAVLFTSCSKDINLSLDPIEVTLVPGETYQLVAKTTENVPLEWSSSNEQIVKVDQNGLITAVAIGEATIKVVANKNGMNEEEYECKVTVKDHYSAYFYFVTSKPLVKYANLSFEVTMPNGATVDEAIADADYVVIDKVQHAEIYQEIYDFLTMSSEIETDSAKNEFMKDVVMVKKELTCSTRGEGSMIMNYTIKGPVEASEPETFNAIFAYSVREMDKLDLSMKIFNGVYYDKYAEFMEVVKEYFNPKFKYE